MEDLNLKELQMLASDYGIDTQNKSKAILMNEINALISFRDYTPSPPPRFQTPSRSPIRSKPRARSRSRSQSPVHNCHSNLLETDIQFIRQSLYEQINSLEMECELRPSAECREKLKQLETKSRKYFQKREKHDAELQQMYMDNLSEMFVIQSVNDGRCLYDSIRIGLKVGYGLDLTIEDVKEIGLKYIKNCGKMYYQYEMRNRDFELLSKNQFIKKMAHPREWGNQEMIVAIAHGLGIQIVVYTADGLGPNDPEGILLANGSCTKDCKVIYIQYNGHNHYDGLIADDDDDISY